LSEVFTGVARLAHDAQIAVPPTEEQKNAEKHTSRILISF
jgi:hypothetical protein